MPFSYPKRVFNIFPLRDLPDVTVIDGMGERNRRVLICRSPWRSERVVYPFLRPLYKERRQKVILSYQNPLGSSQSSLLPSGCTPYPTVRSAPLSAMNKPFLSQKHHVLIKLEMARSGQGWRRLKICLPFLYSVNIFPA